MKDRGNPNRLDPIRGGMNFYNKVRDWHLYNPIEKYSDPKYRTEDFLRYVGEQYYEYTKGYEAMFDTMFEMREKFKEVLKSNEDMKTYVLNKIGIRDSETVGQMSKKIEELKTVARRTKRKSK